MEESSYGQMKFKTWVLKVSIHCEGCKKKVIKLLAGVEGVYRLDVDLKQQSVMVTGNVDADTLIQKLIKSGRHAQLWCQISNHKKPNKLSGKDKKTVELPAGDEKVGSENLGAPERVNQAGDKVEAMKEEQPVGDNKSEVGSESNYPPSAAAAATAAAATEKSDHSESGDGKVSKKKIKKGQNGNCSNNTTNLLAAEKRQDESSVDAGPQNNAVTPARANKPPPRQQPENPHVPPSPSPPVYVMNYNMATTAPSHTTSYYTSPTTPYQERERIAPPSDPEWYPRQPLDSFELFNDENPNGCSIM